MIDIFGNCPHCNNSMDGGDILQSLSAMDIHQFKSREDMLELAGQYGYTLEDKKHFSKYIGHHIMAGKKSYHLLECPDCRQVFEKETGEAFSALHEARHTLKTREHEAERPTYENQLTIEEAADLILDSFDNGGGVDKIEVLDENYRKITIGDVSYVTTHSTWHSAFDEAFKRRSKEKPLK